MHLNLFADIPRFNNENSKSKKHLKKRQNIGFTCNDGRLLEISWICDGVKDCPENEDEQGCGEVLLHLIKFGLIQTLLDA